MESGWKIAAAVAVGSAVALRRVKVAFRVREAVTMSVKPETVTKILNGADMQHAGFRADSEGGYSRNSYSTITSIRVTASGTGSVAHVEAKMPVFLGSVLNRSTVMKELKASVEATAKSLVLNEVLYGSLDSAGSGLS